MKKFLFTLFAGILGFGCFCSSYYINFNTRGSVNFSAPDNMQYYFTGGICFNNVNNSINNRDFYSSDGTLLYSHEELSQNSDLRFLCFVSSGYVNAMLQSTLYTFGYSNGVIFGDLSSVSSSCPECQECSEVNTGEILSGYILESEIDTNYCVGNGYCPNECGSGTDFSGDLVFSNLYINNILHPGKSNIFVEIPDYITWDYSTDTGSFNLYVGSGYDVDYINSIIDINSYRPDSKDFTDIFVGGLTLITPYIVICLFFFLIWKLLRRIFK